MKVLSYSLFGDPSSFEFNWYLRGAYYNVRMNKILLPDFHTTIYTTTELINKYYPFWQGLGQLNNKLTIQEEDNNPQLCEGMLRRMIPLFEENIELVLCRDLDSVITFKEANCINHWLRSGLPYHAINDNPAHGGLMGGLVGFKAKEFKQDTGYKSYDQMIRGLELSNHGSDQNFMNKFIHPKIKHGLLMHKLKGQGIEAKRTETVVPSGHVDKKYIHSDLISRYIGSAGVIDFELLRWFKDHDPDPKFDEFERKYSDVMYWAR
jgi:hypothetical protein